MLISKSVGLWGRFLSDPPGWETDRAAEDATDDDENEFRAEEAAELVPDFKMPFLKSGR